MAADALDMLLRANLAAALAILLALALRKPVRAFFGAGVAYALWAMTPVAMVASLLPGQNTFLSAIPEVVAIRANVTVFVVKATQSPVFDIATPAVAVWLAGAVACLVTLAIRQLRLARAVGRLSDEPGAVRAARAEHSGIGPAVIGVFSPRIVLPTDFRTRYSLEEQAVILAHETAHLRAGDTKINALIALLRCIAWFNPLVHIGAVYARVDQELARDADVAARFPAARRCYAEAMLKSQLATIDLGCGWTPRTAQTLKRRIAMLARPTPTFARRTAGASLVALASVLVGVAAWQPATGQQGSQPPTQQAQGTQQTIPLNGPPGPQADLVPLFRVPPVYPPSAIRDMLNGSCDVSFDLADDGDPNNISAECTDPIFADSAIQAVDQWRYASLANDKSGEPRTDVMTEISFIICDDAVSGDCPNP